MTIVWICIPLFWLLLAGQVAQSIEPDQQSFADYRLVAHRGGIVEDLFDEYDPKSMDAAFDSGYWMLEIDVVPTADSHIVVHHDSTLERIYGVDQSVSSLTVTELKMLRAKRGGYSPLTFEEVAQRCQGKMRIMLDLKMERPPQWFYQKLNDILLDYGLLDESFFITHAHRPYFKGGKFGFRMSELDLIREKIKQGEDVATHYYLFDHGNRINAETALWCHRHNIEICASVNVGHYRWEDDLAGAQRDIEYLKKCGVTIFQIDSQYDTFFTIEGTSKD